MDFFERHFIVNNTHTPITHIMSRHQYHRYWMSIQKKRGKTSREVSKWSWVPLPNFFLQRSPLFSFSFVTRAVGCILANEQRRPSVCRHAYISPWTIHCSFISGSWCFWNTSSFRDCTSSKGALRWNICVWLHYFFSVSYLFSCGPWKSPGIHSQQR